MHFQDFPTEPIGNCDVVAALIRAAVGAYNKGRVDLLPIDDDKVLKALRRAKQQTDVQDIPDRIQAKFYKIIEELLALGTNILKSQSEDS
jgi:FixJ family two-component response regulator